MKKINILALLLIVISCNNPEQKKLSFIKVYEGTIDKYSVTMKLIAENDTLRGNYFYNKVGEYLTIKGLLFNDSIKIEGYDKKNNLLDMFVGTLQNGKMSGTWSKPNGESKMTFTLIESSGSFPAESKISDSLSIENKLTNRLWYSNNNEALVPTWIYFSKSGKYKEWRSEEDYEPKSFTGIWKVIDKGKGLELTSYEYAETTQYDLLNLKETKFEIISRGVSAGSVIYQMKGTYKESE